MSNKTNNGGAAFPCLQPLGGLMSSEEHNKAISGMSLRDWFAGMALQGMIAADSERSVRLFRAYEIADAMLAEREK